MNLRVGSKSDIGQARERNEDAFLVKDRLFAVADGMGGHRGGDVASSMTLDTLKDLDLPEEAPLAALVEQIREANQAVLERGSTDGTLRGMGTTITAFLAEDGKGHVAHVGDSRAYLLRGGAFQQLTEDHTLVQRMVREGRLTPEQARHHPQRSILTRALGVDDELPVAELSLDLHPGDRIVLCTDGLTGMVEEDRIREILESEPDPQAACDRLVEEANRAGGDDNITLIVIDVSDGDGDPGSAEGGEPGIGGTAATTASPGPAPGHEASGGPAGSPGHPSTAVRTAPPEVRADETAMWSAPDAGSGDGAGEARPTAGRRRRIVLWLAVVVVMAGAALVGLRIYVGQQWYVGDSNGRVAIYHGIPAAPLGFHLSHVYEGTEVPAVRAERLQPWRGLADGITASSLPDARNIVTQIRQDLGRTSPKATGR